MGLKLDVAPGKKIWASVGGAAPVDVLGKVAELKQRIASLKESYQPEALRPLVFRKVVQAEPYTKADLPPKDQSKYIEVARMQQAAAYRVDVSSKNCGLTGAQSFQVVGRKIDGKFRIEVFRKGGAGERWEGSNSQVEIMYKPMSTDEWSYALYVKIGTKAWADDDCKMEAAVSLQSTMEILEVETSPPGKYQSAEDVVDLEAQFKQVSTLQISQTYTNEVSFTTGDDGKDYRVFDDKPMYIGKFKATQVVHVDVEDDGCGTGLGLHYTVVGRMGVQKSWGKPRSFNYGSLAQYMNGAATLFNLEITDSNADLVANREYHLWLRAKGTLRGKACGNPSRTTAITARPSTAPLPQPAATPTSTGSQPIHHVGLEGVRNLINQHYPPVNTVPYKSNYGDKTEHPVVYIGRVNSAQHLDVYIDNKACARTLGARFTVVSHPTSFAASAIDMPNRLGPEAFIFGTASSQRGNEIDNLQLWWKPVYKEGREGKFTSSYDMWVYVKGKPEPCGDSDFTNATLSTRVVSSTPLVVPEEGPATLDLTDAETRRVPVVSLEDIATLLDGDPTTVPAATEDKLYGDLLSNFKSGVSSVSGGVDTALKYNCTPDGGAPRETVTKWLGLFHVADVVHMDVSDKGWGSNTGAYINIVGRDGLTTKNRERNCADPDSDACPAPEAFLIGTPPRLDHIWDGIQLYWKVYDASKAGDGSREQAGLYHLYLGVTAPRSCQVPWSLRSKAGYSYATVGKEWAKGKNFEHTLTVSLRRMFVPGAKADAATAPALALDPATGEPKGAGFNRMRRISAAAEYENAKSLLPRRTRQYGGWKDQPASDPIFKWPGHYNPAAVGGRPADGSPGSVMPNLLPYRSILKESPGFFRREFDLRFRADKSGVVWPPKDVPGMVKYGCLSRAEDGTCPEGSATAYPNVDERYGYQYLGRYGSEQVLEIDVEDRMTWKFGNHFTCLSANHFQSDKGPLYGPLAGQRHMPVCFLLGSAGWRTEGGKVKCGWSDKTKGETYADTCAACTSAAIAAKKSTAEQRKWCEGAPGTGSADDPDELDNDCMWTWNRKIKGGGSTCMDQPGAKMSDPPPIYFVYKRTGKPGVKCGKGGEPGECQDAHWWMVIGHRPTAKPQQRRFRVVVKTSSGGRGHTDFLDDSFKAWDKLSAQKDNLMMLDEVMDEEQNKISQAAADKRGINYGQGEVDIVSFEVTLRNGPGKGLCGLWFNSGRDEGPYGEGNNPNLTPLCQPSPTR